MASVSEETEPIGAPPPPADDEGGWLRDKNGRQYVPRRQGPTGRSGPVYRAGDETVQQALERDALPPEKKVASKKRKPPKPPEAPRQTDLKALERELAEALKSPAMVAAMFGDPWLPDHFTTSGPYLARNLIVAAEHNPWLLRKLEEMASGGDAMMKVVTMMGVGGALVAYAVPPIVYIFNLPVPDQAREMFSIPPRREHEPESSEFPLAA